MEEEIKDKKYRAKPARARLNALLIRDIARIITGSTAIETGSETGTEITPWTDELTRISDMIDDAIALSSRKSPSEALEPLISEINTAVAAQQERASKLHPAPSQLIANNRIEMLRLYVAAAAAELKEYKKTTTINPDPTEDYEMIRDAFQTAIRTLRQSETYAAVMPYRTIEVLQTKQAILDALFRASSGEFSEKNTKISILHPPTAPSNEKLRRFYKQERLEYCGKKIWIYSEIPPAILLEKKDATLKTFSLKSSKKA